MYDAMQLALLQCNLRVLVHLERSLLAVVGLCSCTVPHEVAGEWTFLTTPYSLSNSRDVTSVRGPPQH